MKQIDTFVDKRMFDLYSLGSIHFIENVASPRHRRMKGFFGCVQACLWSQSGRQFVMDAVARDPDRLTMLDLHLLRKMRTKYTYCMPLTWQKLVPNEWEIIRKKSNLGKIVNSIALKSVHGSIRLCRLHHDEDCERNFITVYYLTVYSVPLMILFVVILLAFVTFATKRSEFVRE